MRPTRPVGPEVRGELEVVWDGRVTRPPQPPPPPPAQPALKAPARPFWRLRKARDSRGRYLK